MTRILLVEDEPGLLRALGINLRARGYEVDTAGDGTTALATAARHPPDLVVLDLGLPDMDGSDVIRGLRGWTAVPVIVLSGLTSVVVYRTRCLAGAVTGHFLLNLLLVMLR